MDVGAFAFIVDVFEMVLLVVTVVYLFRHSDASRQRSPIVFLGFSYAVLLVSNLYWIAYELMTREAIYEFSAIDIASAGLYLLAGASIAMLLDEREGLDLPVFVGSGIYSIGQAVLWVIWTNMWLKDVLGCLPIWYMAYYLVRGLKRIRAFSHVERVALVVVVAAVAALQVGSFVVWDTFGSALDITSGILCLVVYFGLVAKLYLTNKAEGIGGKVVGYAFSALLWALCSMYLMYEPLYSIFLLLSVLMMGVTAVLVVKRVERA